MGLMVKLGFVLLICTNFSKAIPKEYAKDSCDAHISEAREISCKFHARLNGSEYVPVSSWKSPSMIACADICCQDKECSAFRFDKSAKECTVLRPDKVSLQSYNYSTFD